LAIIERIEHEGVEGVRVGRFNLGVSTTSIVYRLGSTVIDTGPPNQWAEVRAFLAEKPIERVLITHFHEDHSGNGARIREAFGVPVYAPARGLDFIAQGFRMDLHQRLVWGRPPRFRPEPLPDDAVELADGAVLRVLPAPGHAVDQVCLFEPDRGWLFSGDLFIGAPTRYFRRDENVHAYIASLRRLADEPLRVLFCAHRGVVDSPRRALRAKGDHLERIRSEARRLHAEGQSPAAITRRLLGREDLMSRLTFGQFTKRNLITACLAPED